MFCVLIITSDGIFVEYLITFKMAKMPKLQVQLQDEEEDLAVVEPGEMSNAGVYTFTASSNLRSMCWTAMPKVVYGGFISPSIGSPSTVRIPQEQLNVFL